jgi:hypothetical protein
MLQPLKQTKEFLMKHLVILSLVIGSLAQASTPSKGSVVLSCKKQSLKVQIVKSQSKLHLVVSDSNKLLISKVVTEKPADDGLRFEDKSQTVRLDIDDEGSGNFMSISDESNYSKNLNVKDMSCTGRI